MGNKSNSIILCCGLFLISFLMLAGCSSDDSSSEPESSNEEVLENGWQNFSDGNYSLGLEKFESLIAKEALLSEAYAGAGWCQSYQNLPDASLINFNSSLENNPIATVEEDVKAGLGFTYNALDSAQNCLEQTAEIDANWSFSHKSSLDYKDIVILRAASRYFRAEFSQSISEINKIDSDFTADITTAEGRALLAAKIEELKDLYGG